MWRETIETSSFARCGFCSEIIVAERASTPAQQCDWCAQGGVRPPMNDNYFDVVMRVRAPLRKAAPRGLSRFAAQKTHRRCRPAARASSPASH
jgi:hypothetical protein